MGTIWLRKPPQQDVAPRLKLGELAPTDIAGDLSLACRQPRKLVAFLRHVGCPFAEHTVKQLREWSAQHPDVAVFIVSHGDAHTTWSWLDRIGGLGRARLVLDEHRRLYGHWGVGYSDLWHFAGPASLMGVIRLWPRGIYNRNAAGTRWQRSATFLVDNGKVVWRHVPRSAQELKLPPGPGA